MSVTPTTMKNNSIEGTTQIEAFVQECLNRNVSIDEALESVKEEWISQLEEQVMVIKRKTISLSIR
jgi:hypothetical protein